MRESVLKKLATNVNLIEFCAIEPKVSEILRILTLDIVQMNSIVGKIWSLIVSIYFSPNSSSKTKQLVAHLL